MSFNESFRKAKLTGVVVLGTALSALGQAKEGLKTEGPPVAKLNPTEVFTKYSINPDSLIIPVDTIKNEQTGKTQIVLDESNSPPLPPILEEVQKLMIGYHMDLSPKDFTSEKEFVQKYTEEAVKFYKSSNGEQTKKLKDAYYKGKYEDCKNKLKVLKKDKTQFKPTYFCNDEFSEAFGAYEDVESYIETLKGYIESYEKEELVGQLPPNIENFTQQAEGIWTDYELDKQIEAMGGQGVDLELDFSNSTNLKIPFSEFKNINLIETSEFAGFLEDAMGIMPDSSGTFTVIMPRINGGDLVLNKVSKKVIDDFLSGIHGEEDILTAAPGDPDEGFVTANRPVTVYESHSFFEKLLEDGHTMKELEGDIFENMKLRVLLFNEDWDTFVKKWRSENPRKN